MNDPYSLQRRPPAVGGGLLLVFTVVCAFAGGVLLERFGLLPGAAEHAPPGVGRTFEPFWEAWHLVDAHYVDRQAIQPVQMTRGAILGMLASLGDFGHTTYLTPEQYKEMKSGLEGHLEGIGARLTMRKNVPTVVNTLPGSPARDKGLKAGDILFTVNHKPVANLSLTEIVKTVRGPAGTSVHLEVIRAGSKKPIELDIPRAKVSVPEVTWHMLPGVPIAHIAIAVFGQDVDQQLVSALQGAREQGAKALILDVRGNEGGIKDQAVAVTSQFLKGGIVFQEKDAQGHVTNVPVKPGGQATDIPVAVLIDGGTASSAEIFAGALQDYHRGKLIGTKTFGTGTVLQPFPLTDGSVVILAVRMWLTPLGREIWHKGITPDIDVPLTGDEDRILMPEMEPGMSAADLANSHDPQLLKAIEVLKGQVQ
jgi:carboxyl-terminal processing protease